MRKVGKVKMIRILSSESRLIPATEWLCKFAERAGIKITEDEDSYPVRFELKQFKNCPGDSYQVEIKPGGAVISASRLRAALYGADEFLAEYAGVRYFDNLPGRVKGSSKTIGKIIFFPRFPYRSVWVNPVLGEEWIETLVHNRFNSIAIDDILGVIKKKKQVLNLIRIAEKFDLDITMGGHIVSKIVDTKTLLRDHPEYCTLIAGKRTASGHICYSNPQARKFLARGILKFVRSFAAISSSIDRFSIWSEDSGRSCQCEGCLKRPFNENFARAVYDAADLIKKAGLKIRLEFIIYNAGAGKTVEESLETLKPPAAMNSDVDCLVAYWGRDYSVPLSHANNNFDKKGQECVEKAASIVQKNNCFLNSYEYYIDQWQLGDLFPFLGPVIFKDMKYYHGLGVNGFLLDIAGCPMKNPGYPSRFLKVLNLIFSGKAMWNDGIKYEVFLKEFCEVYFNEKKKAGEKILNTLFNALAPLTWLNLRRPLPGFTVWCLDIPGVEFVFDPHDPKQTAIFKRYESLCKAALVSVRKVTGALPEKNTKGSHFEALCWYVNYVEQRLEALYLQLEAQGDLRRGKSCWKAKAEKGLKLDAAQKWPSRGYFKKWELAQRRVK